MTTPILEAALAAEFAAILLALGRVWLGPSAADRVAAFDLVTSATVALAGTLAVAYEAPVLLDVGLVLALVTFVATVALALYVIEWIDGEEGLP